MSRARDLANHADGNITATSFSGDGSNLTGVAKLVAATSAPSTPAVGDQWFDTTAGINAMKVWSGTDWNQMSNKFNAAGGTVTTYSSGGVEYKIHAFTSSGTFTAESTGTVDVLVVAGGGGGGCHVPGGGGAGGLIWKQANTINTGNYSIVIGLGGLGSYNAGNYPNMPNATIGGNSTAFGLTALGGGFGGSWSQDTRSNAGGSGGGRNGNYTGAGTGLQPSQAGDSGVYGYGRNGAVNNSPGAPNYGGGGGGGANQQPANAANVNTSGAGGDGLNLSSYFGTTYGESGWFAGGGEGGAWGTATLSAGGNGGGGDGDCPNSSNGTGNSLRRGSGEPTGYNGMDNTGGGGGGAGRTGGQSSRGGNGGSGIVLIRYKA